MHPKQGARERVFVLMTWLKDDNGDMVEGTDKILAGTSSDKVAGEVLGTFKKFRNGQVTMVHADNADRYTPTDTPNLNKILGLEAIEDNAPESLDAILKMVDL